jgi:hypothetical protein
MPRESGASSKYRIDVLFDRSAFTGLLAFAGNDESNLFPLFQRSQIRHHVVDVLGIGKTAERHAVAPHLGLRVGEILAQVRLVPGEARASRRDMKVRYRLPRP